MPIFNCKLHCKPTAVASGYAEYYNVAIVCQQNHRMIYPVPNSPESRTHDACCICGSQPPPLSNKDLKSGAWRYKIVFAPLAMNSEHGFMHSHPQFVCAQASQLNMPVMWEIDCLHKDAQAALLAQITAYATNWRIPFNMDELRAQEDVVYKMTAGEGDARNDETPEDAEMPPASVLPEPAEETDPDPNKMPVNAPATFRGLVAAGLAQGMPISVLKKMSAETVMHINAYVHNPTPTDAAGSLKIAMVLPIRDLMAALSAKYFQNEDAAKHPLEMDVPNASVYEVGNALAAGFQVVSPTHVVPTKDAPATKCPCPNCTDAECKVPSAKVQDTEDAKHEADQESMETAGRWCQWVATQGFAKTRALHTQVHKSIATNAQGRRMGRSV
jgi:hypothetical protein